MTCKCGASFEVDTYEDDMLATLWAQRFVDGHKLCGFMAPVVQDPQETIYLIDLEEIDEE
jgi:hypothetical protein